MVLNAITKNVRAKAARFLAIVPVLFVSMLFVTASARGDMQTGQISFLQREIVAVDNADHIQMLTIRSDEIGSFPNDDLNFF